MNCEAYEVLLGEVASHIDNDLYALKRSYRFSKKTDFFFNIIKNDIFPEFVKCLDDFKIELYDFKIKNFLGEKKGPVELSRKLTLNAFSDVFSNLNWSVKAGIKKPFSKEKLSSSAFDLKMNTLLGVFRVCYDSYFCSSDPGARLIYEQLNQIYEKLSKIKKGIVFNTFQMQFKFKQSWDASNFKEGYQVELLDSIIKYNSNANSDKLLENIFPHNCLVSEGKKGLSGLVNVQAIRSKLMQKLDANYSAFVMFCVLNNPDDFFIFRVILSDLSFIKESVKSYDKSLSCIRNKYYLEIKDNLKSKDKIIKKYKIIRSPKKSDYFEPQSRVNLVKQVHDSFISNEKLEIKCALNDFKSKLLLNPWTLNNHTYFLNQDQVDRLVSLNLNFSKLISEENISLDAQKDNFLNDIFEFLASDIFKSDKQFDNLLEPLRRLDRWFLNRLSEYVSDNTEKFYLLCGAVSNLKKTSDALRSENNIVLSSNVIFSTYKSELDNNLKYLREILDGIEEDFFNYKKTSSDFSCVPKKSKNKIKSQIKPSVILDTKDKISGVRDILTRISWIRDNFRSNSYCESSYAESGVLVMEV
jgi:hypothetical protein